MNCYKEKKWKGNKRGRRRRERKAKKKKREESWRPIYSTDLAAASKPPPPFPTSRFLYHVPGNRLPVSRPSETVVSSLNSHRLSSTLLDLAALFVRVRLLFDRQQSRDIGRVFQFDCYFRHRSWLCVSVCTLLCFPDYRLAAAKRI